MNVCLHGHSEPDNALGFKKNRNVFNMKADGCGTGTNQTKQNIKTLCGNDLKGFANMLCKHTNVLFACENAMIEFARH